jgi:DNA-binding cell septation regulator SpoVG
MSAFRILEWRPLRKKSLHGFVKVQMPSGMIVIDVKILTGERGAWASPPSKPVMSSDGTTLKDDNGKVRYSSIIEFTSKDIRNSWSDAVIDAIRQAHPEALP